MVAKPERFAVGDQIDKLGRKLNQLVDYVTALNITGDRASVIVRRLSPTRWGVSAIRQGGGGAGGASAYSGMFAVTDATDYSGEAPYAYKINMVGGLAQLESKYHTIEALADFDITEDGYLTLEFDVAEAGGAITYDAENKTTEDAAEDLPLYKGRCIIAAVDISEGRMSITQLQNKPAIVSVRKQEPYSGMFAVTDTTDYSGEAPYSYKINMVGGLAQLESRYHTITALTNLTITQDGYLTLEFDVNEENGAITYTTEKTTTGEAATTLPLWKGRTIVARLVIADNKLTVIQTQYGVAIVTVRTPLQQE